jgi:hypothetical protein
MNTLGGIERAFSAIQSHARLAAEWLKRFHLANRTLEDNRDSLKSLDFPFKLTFLSEEDLFVCLDVLLYSVVIDLKLELVHLAD